MIGTVLGQAQKLFGRSFLTAAFVPTAIAVAAGMSLLQGLGTFGSLVNTWAQGPGKAVFQIGLTVVGIYLLAYVLYGVMGGVNRLHQGTLPKGLGWLGRLLQWNQTRIRRRREDELDRMAVALTTVYWPEDFGFRPTWVDSRLTDEQLAKLLAETTAKHDQLLQSLAQHRPLREDDYRLVLEQARTLQGLHPDATTPFGAQVQGLVEAVAAAYRAHGELQSAVTSIRARALGAWTIAQGEFAISFPGDERWRRPTGFGNLVGALDYSVLERYGITLTDLWPRLLHVITADVRTQVEDANAYLDFTLMMSFLSGATAGVALAAAAGPPRGLLHEVLLVAIPLVGAWLFYRLAMAATRAFGEQVRAGVDLFRLELLDALGVERPRTPADERPIWSELERFIAQGDVPQRHVRFAEPLQSPGSQLVTNVSRGIGEWLARSPR